MAKIAVQLDQQIESEVGDGYGTISIRVVVVTPKAPSKDDEPEPAEISSEFDEEEEEPEDAEGAGPLSAYLEKKSYGKLCAVFLVNGQRHDAWDNSFISRDLEFKFLRDRMMVMVNLDGLSEPAMSEITQGSRQGLYQGKTYTAIKNRLIQTLKSNPELKQLQVDAEQKAMDMKAGDEAVKNKLNQLIEGHHATAPTDGPGLAVGGTQDIAGGHFGDGLRDQPVVVMGGDDGQPAELPVLVTTPFMNAIRLFSGQRKEITIVAEPKEAWNDLEELQVNVVSDDANLTGEIVRSADRATVTIQIAATDYGDEDFPLFGELQGFARFKGKLEPRVLKLPIVVTKKPTPPEPIELLDTPTFLRVRNRQPVRVWPGSTVHVRMQWNGKQSLLRGSNPRWRFSARCASLGTFPRIGFGYSSDGGLTFILCSPNGLMLGANLDFEVTASGPDGAQLKTSFRAVVVEPPSKSSPTPEPKRIEGNAPPMVGQRRPPYELKYVNKGDWNNSEKPCFQGGGVWTEHDAGCFLEPTATQPLLLLVVNEDMALLKSFREGMLKRKPPLDPKTITDRTNRYISYVAFHLYQMYGEKKRAESMTAPSPDAPAPGPASEKDMRAEINRVGTTVMKVMELGAR